LRILNLNRLVFVVCAVIVIPTGCNGGRQSQFAALPSQTSTSNSRLGTARRAKEVLSSISGHAVNPCAKLSGRGRGITITANGDASGKFAGTFTGGGAFSFNRCFTSGETRVSGTFSITSGANSITGVFSGNASYICGRFACRAESTAKLPWTYTAAHARDGKTIKGFSGSAQGFVDGDCCGGGHMTLDLLDI
jgi:hypothetical protein